MAGMIVGKDRRAAFLIALLLSVFGGGVWAQAPKSENIDQLDEVKVTAARIAPLPRTLPFLLPDLSTAVSLPADPFWKRGAPVTSELQDLGRQRLLRDDAALSDGTRTGVRYLEPIQPPYPKRARTMGWEGTVVLRVGVSADGTVAEVAIHKSSGYPLLDQAAVMAARSRRFVPAKDGGFTTSSVAEVPVKFVLTEYMEDDPAQ
jgi:TonB family protein